MTRLPSDVELYKAQLASEQWRLERMLHLPVSQQMQHVVSNKAVDLLESEKQIEQNFVSEMERYLFDPYRRPGPKSTAVDYTGTDPSSLTLAVEPGLPYPLKTGHGVDPLDFEYKPFTDFHQVEQARKDYLESPLFKFRQERDQLSATVNENGDLPDPESRKRFMQVQGEISSLERSTGK